MLSRTILPSSSSSRITIIVDFGVKTSSSSGNNSSSSLHLITTASTKDNSPSIIPRRYQRRGSKCASMFLVSMSSLPGSVVTATGGEVKEQTNSHDKNVYLLLPATTTTVLPVYPATTNEYQKKKTQ